MGVWRKWIFPILRILVFATIAIALVKLAFFPDASDEASPAEPTGTVSESVVTVEKGSVVNEVLVDGSIIADPAVDAKAPLAGDILELRVGAGAKVAKGDVIAVVRKEIVQDPVVDVDEETGEETVTERPPTYRTEEVTAPLAGTVSSLPVVKGQLVEIGDPVASVAPPSFSVTGTIAPEEQYRLQERPTEAAVEVVGGPGSFTCTGLTISVPLAGSAPEGGEELADGGGRSTGATVRCAVPGDVTVFAGLTGTISMPGGSVEDVLVLPVTAVKGNSQAGSVWLMGDDGEPVETAVGLGLNDGTIVEVTGVEEGATVLEFIPVDDATDVGVGDGCIEEPDGSVYCDDGTMEG
jgi:multidrug efflux pump subunit AcrA (membrane-fusion protein)